MAEKQTAKLPEKKPGPPDNYASIKGRLRFDPRPPADTKGGRVLNLVVSVPAGYKDLVTSIRVACWERELGNGVKLPEGLKENDLVRALGTLRSRTYDQDGRKVEVTEIYARELKVLERAPAAEASGDDNEVPF